MKQILSYVWMIIVTIISGVIIMPDRIIQSFIPWRDIAGWNEINKFDHEKENLAKRWAGYIVIAIIISAFWWIPFIYRLTASFF